MIHQFEAQHGELLTADDFQAHAADADYGGKLCAQTLAAGQARLLATLDVAKVLDEADVQRLGGHSEVGVIALNWLVRGKSGEGIVVTASWNDPQAAVDVRRFLPLSERLVRVAAP